MKRYARAKVAPLVCLFCLLLLGLEHQARGAEVGAKGDKVVHGFPELSAEDKQVVKRFIELYYKSGVWFATGWLGIQIMQLPSDNWMMQELISSTKPDFLVETGTYRGGSALFYATVLSLVNPKGKVITVDIDPKVSRAERFPLFKERVTVIKGSSTDPAVIDRITKQVQGHKVMVTLDSRHTKDHVLKELQLYGPLVSPGSYMVAQDTALNGHPVAPENGPGPMEAVEEFLKTHPEFEVDHSAEKFLATFYPSGYLKKIK
jgi:cephalosporin hydroxylase